jgi:Gas vesicle protein
MSDQRADLTGHQDVALVELVDRLLDGGVVIAGDIMLSIADVDLVYVSLRLLLSSVHRLREDVALEEAGL